MSKLADYVFSGMAPAGNCACQLVTRGTEVVVDLACAAHENWRDAAITDAIRAERAACAEVAKEYMETTARVTPIEIARAIEARTDAAEEEGGDAT